LRNARSRRAHGPCAPLKTDVQVSRFAAEYSLR
jgi:hypothetical protein